MLRKAIKSTIGLALVVRSIATAHAQVTGAKCTLSREVPIFVLAAIWTLAEKLADLEMSDEVSPFIPIAEILVAALETEQLKIEWE